MATQFPGDSSYREPLMVDDDGLYITVAQMGFFFNRKNGKKKFDAAHSDFLSYYNHCRLYNLIYDMMEEDPDCAKLYWDHEKGTIALSFPMKGKIANAISDVGEIFETEDDNGNNLDLFE